MLAGIVIGAGIVLATVGFVILSGDRKWSFPWWHWLLMAIGVFTLLFSIAWLATLMSEGVSGQGFIGLGIGLGVCATIAVVIWRTMRRTA